MEREEFQQRLKIALQDIDENVLTYDKSEVWMYESVYDRLYTYAMDNCLLNTAIALPLSRGLHNGSHRRSTITRNGLAYHLPYLIHPLLVCRMLADLQIPLPKEEEDIVLASALCHDMIEDLPFTDGGRELYKLYHLDKRVYDTVKLVSKRKDFSPAEEREHFRKIRADKFALLVKLSDRGNNVEDLYNMSVWKVHEYVGETKRYFLPMCQHGVINFPELYHTIEILLDKMVLLTESSETLVDRYEAEEKKLLLQSSVLHEENIRLRNIWNTYRETGHTLADPEDLPYSSACVIDDQVEDEDDNPETILAQCDELYKSIEKYAAGKKLIHTLSSLGLLKESMMITGNDGDLLEASRNYRHCLLACKILIDLHPVLTREEEDITLSSVLCHILFELMAFDEMPNVFHLDDAVYNSTKLTVRRRALRSAQKDRLFRDLRSSKTAVLAKLADQGVHIQELYSLSIREAQEWIKETRTMVLPLCIAARELYPELFPVISVLMEKMRCLLDVTDILSNRYLQREDALTKEVFDMMEENARICGMIRSVMSH